MLTPQNFREKTFERAIFGGYDMGAVDDFLEEAATDYAAVAKENMVLKGKMKVLVDKIEEYRSTEDSMRLTLLSAQKLCSQMEQEAREKADALIAEARVESERISRDAHDQRISEEAKLIEAKRESTRYIENMRIACSRQLEFYDSLQTYRVETPAEPVFKTETVEDTVRSIENSVERLAGSGDGDKEIGRVVEGGPEVPAGGAVDEPTRMFGSGSSQFSLDNLSFGK